MAVDLPLDEAWKYYQWHIEHGLSIVPVPWGNPSDKSCGKKPLWPNWQMTTLDQVQKNFESAIKRCGGSVNIGLLTGRINNLIIIDIDVTDGGVKYYTEVLEPLLTAENCFPPMVRTGSGGYHLYFNWSPTGARLVSKAKIQSADGGVIGIDVKTNGGMVIAAPSLHRSGNHYEIIRGDITQRPDIPLWLVNLLQPPRVRQPLPNESDDNESDDEAEVPNQAALAKPDKVTQVRELLTLLADFRADEYQEWCNVCLAAARIMVHCPVGRSRAVLEEFSRRSTKYNERETDRLLHGFSSSARRPNGYGFTYLIDLAMTDNPTGFKSWRQRYPIRTRHNRGDYTVQPITGVTNSSETTALTSELGSEVEFDHSVTPEPQGFNYFTQDDIEWADQLVIVFNGEVATTVDNRWFQCKTVNRTWKHLISNDNINSLISQTARDYVISLNLESKDRNQVLAIVSKISFAQRLRPHLLGKLLNEEIFGSTRVSGWIALSDGFKVNLTTKEIQPTLCQDYFMACSKISSQDLLRIQAGLTDETVAQDWIKIDNFMKTLAFNRHGQVDPEIFDYHIRNSIYCLSGYNHWDVFYNFFGRGSDGKSTYILGLVGILGGMAEPVSDNTLHAGSRQGGASHTAHLIPLAKARLIYQDEVTEGKLDEGFIRSIASSASIAARGCGGDQIEGGLKTVAKLVCATNYVLSLSPGLMNSRRIRAESLKCRFTANPVRAVDVALIPGFRDWIKGPGSAMFLHYLLTKSQELTAQGWRLDGPEIEPPKSIRDFSQVLQNNDAKSILRNSFEEFMRESVTRDENARTTTSEILRSFKDWAGPDNYEVAVATTIAIGRFLAELDTELTLTKGVNRYHLRVPVRPKV